MLLASSSTRHRGAAHSGSSSTACPQGQPNVVESIQQAVLAKRVGSQSAPQAPAHRSRVCASRSSVIWCCGFAVERAISVSTSSSVNRGEYGCRSCQHSSRRCPRNVGAITARKPYWLDRPCGVLSRRSAAKVLFGDQDLGTRVLWPVQNEGRILCACIRTLLHATASHRTETRRTLSALYVSETASE